MLAVVVSLLLFIGGARSEALCGRIDRNCDHISVIKKPPTSVEELLQNCPLIIPYVDCTWENIKNCTGDDSKERLRSFVKEVLATIRELCNISSELHKEAAPHFKCVMENIEKMQRPMRCLEVAKDLYQTVLNQTRGENMESFDHEYCMMETGGISCLILHIKNSCGSSARDVVLKILLRGALTPMACPKEIVRAMAYATDGLEEKIDSPM